MWQVYRDGESRWSGGLSGWYAARPTAAEAANFVKETVIPDMETCAQAQRGNRPMGREWSAHGEATQENGDARAEGGGLGNDVSDVGDHFQPWPGHS